jgi:aryl-alcohol dehydrogenase-like predicted oxidoreductase
VQLSLNTLGRGGMRLTRLGLGMAALGRPAYINLGHGSDFPEGRSVSAMRAHAHAVMDAAYAHGIRYFDAARSYGEAESFVASWLTANADRAGRVLVGSKWGYVYEGGWRLDAAVHERKDHSVSTFRHQLGETRSVLGSALRVYQIHSATPESGVLASSDVLDALAELRATGVEVGVSVSGPGQTDAIRQALSIERDGRPLFASIQATWNLLEPAAEGALREAHDAGRVVLLKEPLANGRLTPRGDAGAGRELSSIALAHGVETDAIALAAALAPTWADVVLLGASTIPQLESNLRAEGVQLTARDLARLDGLREPSATYWAARSRLPWN